MYRWDPWRGCHKCSTGCLHCYIHKGDAKRGIDTNNVIKTEKFDYPIVKNKKGEYKLKGGNGVYLCFATDFLVEDADPWREECFKMIKERSDLHFIFLTKRIDRFMDCIPSDWNDGYDNITVGCTVEDQANVDYKLGIFKSLPIKHKNIILQPLIEKVSIEKYLDGIELVVVGGESDTFARPLNYEWVLAIRDECLKHHVHFNFRQCGTHFIMNNKLYTLQVKDLISQARKANIDF